MVNIVVAFFSVVVCLLAYKLYLGHKAAMERKERLKDARSIFIG
tara:strand:+ start:452 stop:583 length:132 start_codon:yes stop_codon:yes gene_type:complete